MNYRKKKKKKKICIVVLSVALSKRGLITGTPSITRRQATEHSFRVIIRGINLRCFVFRDAQGSQERPEGQAPRSFFFSFFDGHFSHLPHICKAHFKKMTQLGIDGRTALCRVTDNRQMNRYPRKFARGQETGLFESSSAASSFLFLQSLVCRANKLSIRLTVAIKVQSHATSAIRNPRKRKLTQSLKQRAT